MKAVYKYRLAYDTGFQTIHLPIGAEILKGTALQEEVPGSLLGCVSFWAEIDPDTRSTERRHFALIPTGAEFDKHVLADGVDASLEYVATAATPGSVWHIYELIFKS